MAYLNPDSGVPEKGKGSKMSKKMELFVSEYFVDMNASAAILRAGYKTKTPNRLAVELMRHPLVKQAIEIEMTKKLEHNEVKADYLINKLISIIENTETSNPSACLKAIELAGKSIALWKERQEISGPNGGAIQTQTEQKIKEDVESFTSSISRLARRSGESEVSKFPHPDRDS